MKKYRFHVFLPIIVVMLMGNTAEAMSLRLLPEVTDSTIQSTFTLDVKIEGVTDLGGFQFDMTYDPAIVSFQKAESGTFTESTGRQFDMIGPDPYPPAGSFTYGAFSYGSSPAGASGDGIIARIMFGISDPNSVGNFRITWAEITDTQLTSANPNLDNAKAEVVPFYKITASAGSGGSISPPGETKVKKGLSQTYSITPSSCYHIANVMADGISVGNVSQYPFPNVDKTHTIQASFEINSFVIQASAGNGGHIAPTGNVTVSCGQTQKFTITPNTGYRISDVKADNVSKGKITEYSFPNVISAHTIHAEFYLAPAGDIDGNDVTDLADAISALRILSGIETGNTNIHTDADVNGDGKIGIEEVVYILQTVAGLRP